MLSMNGDLRWWAKKAGRVGCAVLTAGGGIRSGVRVLTYHRFGDSHHDPFSIAESVFETHMRWLAEHDLAVSLDDVRRYAERQALLPNGGVLVTIDDGFTCLRTRALPILQRYGIPAVAFVPAGLIGTSDLETGERLRWDEVRQIADAGVTIGSHGWSHRSLGRLPPARVYEEARCSRCEIEDRLGRAVDSIAYPFGTRADADADVAAIVRDCGYRCAFTSQHGPVTPDADLFLLPRVKVEGGEPPWMFEGICRGGLDAWRWVDRTLWKLQAAEN